MPEVSEVLKTIDEECAQELVWGYNPDEFTYVATQQGDKHRWYTTQLIVFKEGDDLYGFYYYEPATEEQDGQDVFDGDPVPVYPVTAREVTTTEYLVAK